MSDLHYPIPQDVSLLPLARALAKCQQQHDRVATRFMDSVGLTPSQFDALAVLGDSPGMTMKELSQLSMITGGTLTPVLDRLEAKGLVTRCKGTQDSRQTIVALTPQGQALYEQAFLPFVAHMRTYSDKLTPDEQQTLVKLLDKFTDALS